MAKKKSAPLALAYDSGPITSLVSGFLDSSDTTFRPKSRGTIEQYRRMRTNPTLALARAVGGAAMRSPQWSIESDENVDDTAVKFVDSQVTKQRSDLLYQASYAYDYGFQTVGINWGFNELSQKIIRSLKPVLPETVKEIEVDDDGKVSSVELQKDVVLEAGNFVHFIYDSEGGNPFGRSRNENIREHAFQPWIDEAKSLNKYSKKMSGTVPIMQYPLGTSQVNGQSVSNAQIAKDTLATLGRGFGVAMPKVLIQYAEEALKRGMKPDDLLAWTLTFLESSSGFGAESLATLQHYEKLIMRGWLVPERVATEGQFGTKAEAGEHADIMMATAMEDSQRFVTTINECLVDPLVVANFGSSLKGKIRIVAAPIDKESEAFIRGIVRDVLVNPANIDILTSLADFDAAMDRAKFPKLKRVANIDPNTPNRPAPLARRQNLARFLDGILGG